MQISQIVLSCKTFLAPRAVSSFWSQDVSTFSLNTGPCGAHSTSGDIVISNVMTPKYLSSLSRSRQPSAFLLSTVTFSKPKKFSENLDRPQLIAQV